MWNICICYKCMCIWQTYWKSGFDYMEICKSVFITSINCFSLVPVFELGALMAQYLWGVQGENPPPLISEVDSTVGQTAGCVVLQTKPPPAPTAPLKHYLLLRAQDHRGGLFLIFVAFQVCLLRNEICEIESTTEKYCTWGLVGEFDDGISDASVQSLAFKNINLGIFSVFVRRIPVNVQNNRQAKGEQFRSARSEYIRIYLQSSSGQLCQEFVLLINETYSKNIFSEWKHESLWVFR